MAILGEWWTMEAKIRYALHLTRHQKEYIDEGMTWFKNHWITRKLFSGL